MKNPQMLSWDGRELSSDASILGSTLHCTATPDQLSRMSLMRMVVEVVVLVLSNSSSFPRHHHPLCRHSTVTADQCRAALGPALVKGLCNVHSQGREHALRSCCQLMFPKVSQLVQWRWSLITLINTCFSELTADLNFMLAEVCWRIQERTYCTLGHWLFKFYDTFGGVQPKIPVNVNQPWCSYCLSRTVANETACYLVKQLILRWFTVGVLVNSYPTDYVKNYLYYRMILTFWLLECWLCNCLTIWVIDKLWNMLSRVSCLVSQWFVPDFIVLLYIK